MNYKELMIKSLSSLLEDGETLCFPIYATLLQKNARWFGCFGVKNVHWFGYFGVKNVHWFGYFGITEQYLLIALLQGSSKVISWTTRIPLDIKRVTIKRMLTPLQYKIDIDFFEGDSCNIRASKKVYGIESQEINLKGFIDFIQNR